MAVTAALVHSGFDFNFHIFSIAAVFITLMGFVAGMSEAPEDRIPLSLTARRSMAIGLLAICGLGAWFIGSSVLSHRYTVLGTEVKLNDWDQAEIYYRKAMQLDAKSPIPPLLLGDIYLNKSQWHVRPGQQEQRKEYARQAVQFYEQAVKLNPYYVLALNRMARAYQALQDKERMLAVCERSTTLDPNTPVIPLFLARYYLAQNDLLQAEKAAIKARTLNWGYWDSGPEDVLEDIRSRQKQQ
jgi:tetratricopeptide (TPR) repeat protein